MTEVTLIFAAQVRIVGGPIEKTDYLEIPSALMERYGNDLKGIRVDLEPTEGVPSGDKRDEIEFKNFQTLSLQLRRTFYTRVVKEENKLPVKDRLANRDDCQLGLDLIPVPTRIGAVWEYGPTGAAFELKEELLADQRTPPNVGDPLRHTYDVPTGLDNTYFRIYLLWETPSKTIPE